MTDAESYQKEEFSRAHVHAVTTQANVTIGHWNVDKDGVDVTLRRGGRMVDLRLKCTRNARSIRGDLVFDLDVPTYDKLVDPDRSAPAFLTLMIVPPDVEHGHQDSHPPPPTEQLDAAALEGEIDPKGGLTVFAEIGQRWLDSRFVDPSAMIRYEASYRLHVLPEPGHKALTVITPSLVQAWVGQMARSFSPSSIMTAFHMLQGVIELAVADESIKKNPTKSRVVQVPLSGWAASVIRAHAKVHRPSPYTLTRCPENRRHSPQAASAATYADNRAPGCRDRRGAAISPAGSTEHQVAEPARPVREPGGA